MSSNKLLLDNSMLSSLILLVLCKDNIEVKINCLYFPPLPPVIIKLDNSLFFEFLPTKAIVPQGLDEISCFLKVIGLFLSPLAITLFLKIMCFLLQNYILLTLQQIPVMELEK